jgi:parallel beta-helix repeat protein
MKHPLFSKAFAILALAGGFALPARGVSFRYASSSRIIYVDGAGTATLSDIKTALPRAPLTLVNASNAVWELHANLRVTNGATLELHGTEIGGDVNQLRLQSNNNSNFGAFVVLRADYGTIDIRNTKITSWNDAANAPDTEYSTYGRAYIHARSSLASDGTTALESTMNVINSNISYLGFNGSEAYGLVWKVLGTQSNIHDLAKVYGDIQNSRIHHNYYGVYTFGAFQATWTDNEVDHNVGYGFDPHDYSSELDIENNYVHDNGNHGIIASKHCTYLTIVSNTSTLNKGNGIMLHRSSDFADVEDNVCTKNGDAGIALFETMSSTIVNNKLTGNVRGIRLSLGSSDNLVQNNNIGSNSGYGIYFYMGSDTPEVTDGRNRDNLFTGNQVHDNVNLGIQMSDSDDNVFQENTFTNNGGGKLAIARGDGNTFIANSIPSNTAVSTTGNSSFSGTTYFEKQASTLIRVDTYSTVEFDSAEGFIFQPEEPNLATEVTTSGASLFLDRAVTGGQSLVNMRNLKVSIPSGIVDVAPTTWQTSGARTKTWLSQTSSSSLSVTYTVGDLSAGTTYRILKNNSLLGTQTADNSGTVAFSSSTNTTDAVEYTVTPIATISSTQ